jgi:cytochrome c oxidase cbb3-type subunit 1
VGMNVHQTLCGAYAKAWENVPLRFMIFGAAAYVVAAVAAAFMSLERVSLVTNFTWLLPAQTQLFLYGFFAMTMLGAVYHIVPRLLGAEFCPRAMRWNFWLSALGIVVYALPLAMGGLNQGSEMNLRNDSMVSVTHSLLMFLRISTTGDLLLLGGSLALLVNFILLLVRVGRPAVSAAWVAHVKTVEAAR